VVRTLTVTEFPTYTATDLLSFINEGGRGRDISSSKPLIIGLVVGLLFLM